MYKLSYILYCLLFSQGVTLTDLQEAEKTIGRSRSTRTREQENEEKEKEEKEKQDKEKQEEKKESETKDDDYRQRYSRTVEEVFSWWVSLGREIIWILTPVVTPFWYYHKQLLIYFI